MPNDSPLSPEETLFAQRIVAEMICSPEQVGECVAELRRQALEGVHPLPRLADLLALKGYLPADRDLPPEVADAARDPANVHGKYVRAARLGGGGMGEVWKAWDRDLRRWVALKFLTSAAAEDAARLRREAQTVAGLNHPNIAAVYEIGEWREQPFIAMQLVRGPTLADFPRCDRRAIAALLRDAARAVQAAHDLGIVHRDLKPENLMVEGPRVFVMDFGLAKRTAVPSSLSLEGAVVGTPAYMPPEQVEGKVDRGSDVYSLGATLYFLITGAPPFAGQSVYEILDRVRHQDPRPPREIDPSIPRDLETVCLKAMRKDRTRRYASAVELAEDLERWLRGEHVRARPPGLLERAAALARGHRTALAAATGAVAVSLMAFLLYQANRPVALRLESTPAGAEVFLNDRPAGRTGSGEEWRTPSGEVVIRLELSGHRPLVSRQRLAAGSSHSLSFTLEPITGRLSITTDVDGAVARAERDGKPAGEWPCPVAGATLREGTYEITVSARNRIDVRRRVAVTDGRESVVHAPLPPRLLLEEKLGSYDVLLCARLSGAKGVVAVALNPKEFTLVDSSMGGAAIMPLQPPMSAALSVHDAVFLDGGPDCAERVACSVETESGAAVVCLSLDRGNTAWRVELDAAKPGGIAALYGPRPAVVVAGTRGAKDDTTTLVRALAAADGASLWQVSLRGARLNVQTVEDLDGDGVSDIVAWGVGASVISGADGKVLLDAPDRIVWAFRLRKRPVDGWVFTSATSEGIRDRALDGRELRRVSIQHPKETLLAEGPGEDLVVYGDGHVARIDGITGAAHWERAEFRPWVSLPPICTRVDRDAIEDVVFLENSGRVVCLSGSDGRTLWECTVTLNPSFSGERRFLLAVEGEEGARKIAVGTGGNGVAWIDAAVEPRMTSVPKPEWCRKILLRPSQDGRYPDVIVASDEGIGRISAFTGTSVWRRPFQGPLRELHPVGASLLVARGTEAESHLEAYSASDGRLQWSRRIEGPGKWLVLNDCGDRVFVLAAEPKGAVLLCHDLSTGEVRWSKRLTSLWSWDVDRTGREVAVLIAPMKWGGEPPLIGQVVTYSADDGHATGETPAHFAMEEGLRCVDVDGDGVAEFLFTGKFYQLVRRSTGTVLWARAGSSDAWGSVVAVRRESVLTHTECIEPQSGRLLWKRHSNDWFDVPGRDLLFLWDAPRCALVRQSDGLIVDSEPARLSNLQYYPGRAHVVQGDALFVSESRDDAVLIHRVESRGRFPTAFRSSARGRTRVDACLTSFVAGKDDPPDADPESCLREFLDAWRKKDWSRFARRCTWDWDDRTLPLHPDWRARWAPGARELICESWMERRSHVELRREPEPGEVRIERVETRGDASRITLAAALPWLGRVVELRRRDGRWKVMTDRFWDVAPLGVIDLPSPEEEAAQALHVIARATENFRNSDSDGDGIQAYWTGDVAGLRAFPNQNPIEESLALADAAPLKAKAPPAAHQGYLFRAMKEDPDGRAYAIDLNRDGTAAENKTRFGFCAYPEKYPDSGRMTLIIDERRTAYKKDEGGKPASRFPKDPAAEGWTRVE